MKAFAIYAALFLVVSGSAIAGAAIAENCPRPARVVRSIPHFTTFERGYIAPDWQDVEAAVEGFNGQVYINSVADGFCVQNAAQVQRVGIAAC